MQIFGVTIVTPWIGHPFSRGTEGWELASKTFTAIGIFAAAFLSGFGLAVSACSSGANDSPGFSPSPDAGGGGGKCESCVADKDCNGGVCAQIGGDAFCVAPCSAGKACSASGSTCASVVSAAGAHVSACIPSNECGVSVGGTSTDDGGAAVGPPGGGIEAGAVSGTVGVNGGSVSRLFFGVVGDTRPPTEDDISGYPTSVITGIFKDIQALSPSPTFVVSTGDYQFSNPRGTSANAQLDLYLAARAGYTGVQFPTMGNHECTGGTTSNCGTGNVDGITNNYTAFMTKLLAPLGVTKPYYEVDIKATDSSWTSKFLFVAANAWDSAQQSWFQTAMAKPTTYTFIVRHESASTSPAPPGVAGSEAIMAKYPYTLSIVGHTHSYYHGKGSKEVLVGNGGAPLTSKSYGFAVLSQRSDGAIVGDMVDAATKQTDSYFHFVVKPDGTFTN